MNRMLLVVFFVIEIFSPPGALAAQRRADATVDHSAYAGLLSRYVHNGMVDYAGFRSDERKLDAYLESLAEIDPGQLETGEQFAFYINLYNAWTIKLILTRYPDLESIKDLGSVFRSPWKKPIVKLRGRQVTLDHIEHDILRPRFQDPRVHFAVNCASRSCPPLLDEPYTGAQLKRQLDRVTSSFINDPASNYLDGRTLYVSRIFKWFADDFNNEIVGFFRKYAKNGLAEQLQNDTTTLKVNYLPYDWSLNSAN